MGYGLGLYLVINGFSFNQNLMPVLPKAKFWATNRYPDSSTERTTYRSLGFLAAPSEDGQSCRLVYSCVFEATLSSNDRITCPSPTIGPLARVLAITTAGPPCLVLCSLQLHSESLPLLPLPESQVLQLEQITLQDYQKTSNVGP